MPAGAVNGVVLGCPRVRPESCPAFHQHLFTQCHSEGSYIGGECLCVMFAARTVYRTSIKHITNDWLTGLFVIAGRSKSRDCETSQSPHVLILALGSIFSKDSA